MSAAPVRDLTALFEPRSVGVIGASDDPTKWGNMITRHLLAAHHPRSVYLVNRKGGTVLGQPTLTRLVDAPEPVELVVICVPAGVFVEAVDDALSAGAKAIVAITAGLSELSDEGREIEEEALRHISAAGAVLVGPNCLGVIDTTSSLYLSSDPFNAGNIAVLSQSGNVVIDIDRLLDDRGLGISRFVSLGNQSDVSLAELMRAMVDHEGTRAVAIYAEDVRDGRAFVAAARELAQVGKPVVLLAPGRSAAATRGAASHTGSLTSPARVIDAACAAGAVHRVETPDELVDALVALVGPRRAAGTRTAVFTDGGGHGAIACDALYSQGFDVPQLSDELGALLKEDLWEPSPVSNPVDLAGMGERDPMCYHRGVARLLASDEVDSVLWIGYFGGYSMYGGAQAEIECVAARAVVATVHAQSKPLVVASMFPDAPSVRILREGGIPVYRAIGDAAAGLAALRAKTSPAFDDSLDLLEPAPPLPDTDYISTRELFLSHGVPFPALAVVRSEAELNDAVAAGELGFPLVLKAMGLLHKSDSGGVILGIRDHESLLSAYRDLIARLDPPAVTVEQMADLSQGVEVIVGVQQDLRFGPVVLVGLGGVFTEVLADVAFALAPVSEATAESLLRGLRGAPLLEGARGRAPVDMAALARVVASVSKVALSHPELVELEVNPVLASASGALALDARAIRSTD
ncbi:MAG: acetate--CoA ligase family protein [Actinomycetes bacterium]